MSHDRDLWNDPLPSPPRRTSYSQRQQKDEPNDTTTKLSDSSPHDPSSPSSSSSPNPIVQPHRRCHRSLSLGATPTRQRASHPSSSPQGPRREATESCSPSPTESESEDEEGEEDEDEGEENDDDEDPFPFPSPSPTTLAALPPAPIHITLSLLPDRTPPRQQPALELTISALRTTTNVVTDGPNPWTPSDAKTAVRAARARLIRTFEAYGLARRRQKEKKKKDDCLDGPRGYYRTASTSAWRQPHVGWNEDDLGMTVIGESVMEVGFASGAAMMVVIGAVLGDEERGWGVRGFEMGIQNELWKAEDEKMHRREDMGEILNG